MSPYELEIYARTRQAELLAEADAYRRVERARAAVRLSRMERTGGGQGQSNGSARTAAVRRRKRQKRRQPIMARIARTAARLLAQLKLASGRTVAGRGRPA